MTKEVICYFNIFQCGMNLLDTLYVMYQQAFMATPQDTYYTNMLENLVKINNQNGEPLSNDNIWQAVGN